MDKLNCEFSLEDFWLKLRTYCISTHHHAHIVILSICGNLTTNVVLFFSSKTDIWAPVAYLKIHVSIVY
jgi:hypothetical protein